MRALFLSLLMLVAGLGSAAPAQENPLAPGWTLDAAAPAALEAAGHFRREACEGRFDVLTRTGNIHPGCGSARPKPASAPLRDAVVDIVLRGPDPSVRIAGIIADRFRAVGFVENRPVAGTWTPEERATNRRIAFSVAND